MKKLLIIFLFTSTVNAQYVDYLMVVYNYHAENYSKDFTGEAKIFLPGDRLDQSDNRDTIYYQITTTKTDTVGVEISKEIALKNSVASMDANFYPDGFKYNYWGFINMDVGACIIRRHYFKSYQ